MRERSVQSLDDVKEAASRWVPRLASGLSVAEEEQFEAWIEADPRHATVLAEQQAVWDRFGSLAGAAGGTAPDPDRYAPAARSRARLFRIAAPFLAAAAALALGIFGWPSRTSRSDPPATRVALPTPLEQRTLPDGSIVELNRGAEIAVAFTSAVRRVQLLRGEANFTVEKSAVPFVVMVDGIEVRAVGTAFNVRFDAAAVEVVVTQGKVQVTPRMEDSAPPAPPIPILEAGHSTRVPLAPLQAAPQVSALTAEELESRLAWRPKVLDFDDAPLAAIVAEFNRRNPVRLVIRDPSLGSLRLNASFRSDNMEGFARLLESHFGIRTEPLSATEIGLRQAR